jgi:hypothetical protein
MNFHFRNLPWQELIRSNGRNDYIDNYMGGDEGGDICVGYLNF